MKILAPSYYPQFSCIADACRHNCCVGWEIDIDEQSLEGYRQAEGLLGQRLRDSIVEEPAPHFCLTAEERCPFLNERNLCDLITEWGEGALCQICADHPRFRNDWADRTEIGLGLCCEAAGRLILSQPYPMTLIPVGEEEEPEEEDFWELELRAFRDEALSLVGNDALPLQQRLDALLEWSGAADPGKEMGVWAARFLPLERLDPAWGEFLERLSQGAGNVEPGAGSLPEIWFARAAEYFLYRHLPGAMVDDRLEARTAFAVLSTRFLQALSDVTGAKTLEDVVELARLYSSEIEYSDENLETILEQLDCQRELTDCAIDE